MITNNNGENNKKREEEKPAVILVSDLDPYRIARPPDKTRILLSGGTQQNQGFIIKHIEMRQYIERKDGQLGDYSLLTVMIKTDKGTVEVRYDEGFRGPDALDSAVMMLTQYTGLASLINRALIELLASLSSSSARPAPP